MKKVATLSALLLLPAAVSYAQSNWQHFTVSGIDPADTIRSLAASGSLAIGSVSGNPINNSVRSVDSGKTWSALTTVPALTMKALSTLFIYGIRGDSIMRTTDGGINWLVVDTNLTNLNNMRPADIFYINSTTAWAVGDSPFVAITTNDWTTHTIQRFQTDDSVSMSSVQFLNNTTGFAVGKSTKVGSQATVIFRTTDAGASWQNRGLPDTCSTTPTIVADFINPDAGWAVQTCDISSASIYKTTDGGANWTLQDALALSQIFDIDAVNPLNVWIVGTGGIRGQVFKTTDGGTNWGQEFIPGDPGKLLSVNMLNASYGYASGTGGTLLVYSPTGTDVPPGSSNRPKSFELYQNYPNPFNTGTTIRFSLSKRQRVTLTVYNLLGQPVKTILNEEMPVGKNETNWDGRDDNGAILSSGIYLYELRTSFEKQVRKMLLLK